MYAIKYEIYHAYWNHAYAKTEEKAIELAERLKKLSHVTHVDKPKESER